MLKFGFVKAIKYVISTTNSPGENDQINSIKYIKISEREDNIYEIEIYFNDNSINDYWNFKIDKIERKGKIIDGQLFKISWENSGIVYIDDEAKGNIKMDLDQNIVTVEVLFHDFNSESNIKIIWENTIVNNLE